MPSAILHAVYRGEHEDLARLLASAPSLTIFEAAATGDAARIRELVKGDPQLVHGRSDDGWTPLHLAAFFGHGDAVGALLSRGADVSAVSSNHEGNTALHAAQAARDRGRIVTMLLAQGADVNARDAGQHTSLHHAAFRDDVALVNTLLARGADPAARNRDGQTPQAIAEARGHTAVARRLRGELP